MFERIMPKLVFLRKAISRFGRRFGFNRFGCGSEVFFERFGRSVNGPGPSTPSETVGAT